MSKQLRWYSNTWVLLFAVSLSGCSQLPLGGPAYRDIDGGAASALSIGRNEIAYDYALVDVSPVVLDALSDFGVESLERTFGSHGDAAPVIRVGVGDVVQVSIFESAAGGLFVPADASGRPGNFITLPTQSVGRSGNISVPYAGEIRAAGRSTIELQRNIESKLSNRAIQPQVMVSLLEQAGASASVVGDTLNGANKFKLSGAGDRILDLIARAGGIRYPGYELFVTLQRDNRRATVYFPRFISHPHENLFVRPGDTIYVSREQQKFVAIGAFGSVSQTSGLTGQFAFEQERLSLNEAIAKAGGLQDSRANPSQVFLYRMEHREALTRIGVNVSKFPPNDRLIPTVYRANFRDPSSFFFAQKFSMRNKDVVYATNSDSTEVTKLLTYLRTVTSTVAGASTDGAVTRDVIAGRHILQ